MKRDALIELFDYTTFTWGAYRRAVQALPADALTRALDDAPWPDLGQALFHIASAWDGWLQEQLGAPEVISESADGVAGWADLQGVRDRTRGWLRRVIEETPALETQCRVWPGDAFEMDVSIGEVLTHVLLHERGHHGDINTLLTCLGAQAPQSEYLAHVWFRQHAKK